MIRNRRADTGIEWTKRNVETIPIEFSKMKMNYINAICSLGNKGEHMNKSQFSIMTLQREACSSREAVYYTLKNMLQKRRTRYSCLSTENPTTHFPSGKSTIAILKLKKRWNSFNKSMIKSLFSLNIGLHSCIYNGF